MVYKPLYKWYMKHIEKILDSEKTIFRYKDIELLLGISNRETIKSFFWRAVEEGVFCKIQSGVYGLKKYNPYELWTKLKKNSYISFETVLREKWVIFQDYWNQVFLASDNTLEKYAGNKKYCYLKIKNDILTNPLGLEQKRQYMQASVERALCDRLYLTKNYHFDNLEHINWENLEEISQIYNKRVILAIKKLKKNAQ